MHPTSLRSPRHPQTLRRAAARPSADSSSAARWLALALFAAPGLACSQDAGRDAAAAAPPLNAPASASTSAQAERIVITATRTGTRAFDVPASIDRIDADAVRNGRAQVNISESLGGVPGLLARDRQNYAQDVQISVRGFGARSTFGIRGVRLYVDGIPATLPDGQGQISNVDLGSVGRIEVLRGPFSALYGNSSGGVIQVFSEDGSGPPEIGFGVAGGSDGALRVSARTSGATSLGDDPAGLRYLVSASRFTTDGWRDHSATERKLGNAKLTLKPGASTTVTLVANSVALPLAQDPLGLSRAQFDANPRGVDPSALSFDTRKTVNQTQGGAIVEQALGDAHALRLLAYRGHRGTEQFQSIPVATQASPLHPGGVIVLGRDYHGADLRWTFKTRLADAPFSLIAGIAHDALDEQRRGLQNFTAGTPPTLGVRGALRRDEANDVTSNDQYLQLAWQPLPQWTVNAGVRHSSVRFASRDAYITATNRDDSGSARYGATLPVLGVLFAASDSVHLYATAGRGFETPTLNELAYRPNGATGLNFALQSARSSSAEAGVKTRIDGLGTLNAAVFRTGTEREIVTQSNVGGRATFQNAGATRRSGLELAWSHTLAADWRAQLAATVLNARYVHGFATCTVTPCAVPNQQIPAGNRIPGIARGSLFAALEWLPPAGWRGGIEARWLSRVPVNDANSDAAAGHAVTSAHAGYLLALGRWDLNGFVRVDNLLDRGYAGSVIVNEGNARYFEPAPGRTWLGSVSARLRF